MEGARAPLQVPSSGGKEDVLLPKGSEGGGPPKPHRRQPQRKGLPPEPLEERERYHYPTSFLLLFENFRYVCVSVLVSLLSLSSLC